MFNLDDSENKFSIIIDTIAQALHCQLSKREIDALINIMSETAESSLMLAPIGCEWFKVSDMLERIIDAINKLPK